MELIKNVRWCVGCGISTYVCGMLLVCEERHIGVCMCVGETKRHAVCALDVDAFICACTCHFVHAHDSGVRRV